MVFTRAVLDRLSKILCMCSQPLTLCPADQLTSETTKKMIDLVKTISSMNGPWKRSIFFCLCWRGSGGCWAEIVSTRSSAEMVKYMLKPEAHWDPRWAATSSGVRFSSRQAVAAAWKSGFVQTQVMWVLHDYIHKSNSMNGRERAYGHSRHSPRGRLNKPSCHKIRRQQIQSPWSSALPHIWHASRSVNYYCAMNIGVASVCGTCLHAFNGPRWLSTRIDRQNEVYRLQRGYL